MTDVFVIRNQLGHYWGKSKAWVDGSEARAVMRARHEDEAINTLFELSSKDFELRGEVVAVQLNERGEPEVEVSETPLPQDPAQEPATETDAEQETTGAATPESPETA